MTRVLLTGMSGTGKSTVIKELAARGYTAIDTDYQGFSELVSVPDDQLTGLDPGQDWVWREDRIQALLSARGADLLFLSGCAPNQGMYETGSEPAAEMDQPRRRHQPRVHGSGLSHPTGDIYVPGYRFGMYRWHIMDPIRFQQELRVTIQALGWWAEPGEPLRYRPGEDEIASTALWYQTEPHAPYPPLPGIEALAVD